MYNSERYPSDFAVCEGMQRAFEDLLREYKVRAVARGRRSRSSARRPTAHVWAGLCCQWRRRVPQVDLTLYGHYHSYQRTCPVYQNSCVDDGLVRRLGVLGVCAA